MTRLALSRRGSDPNFFLSVCFCFDPDSLLAELPDLADESTLRDRMRADFASWQIEQIEGWQISRTEAVLCSAIALNLC